mmetsp:Transcript_19863/g.46522  ORF Transcript_19863/g.46522 Transcript_19863/m.46522 type:complete len:691 (+) Transcript_19863:1840-3912(+)
MAHRCGGVEPGVRQEAVSFLIRDRRVDAVGNALVQRKPRDGGVVRVGEIQAQSEGREGAEVQSRDHLFGSGRDLHGQRRDADAAVSRPGIRVQEGRLHEGKPVGFRDRYPPDAVLKGHGEAGFRGHDRKLNLVFLAVQGRGREHLPDGRDRRANLESLRTANLEDRVPSAPVQRPEQFFPQGLFPYARGFVRDRSDPDQPARGCLAEPSQGREVQEGSGDVGIRVHDDVERYLRRPAPFSKPCVEFGGHLQVGVLLDPGTLDEILQRHVQRGSVVLSAALLPSRRLFSVRQTPQPVVGTAPGPKDGPATGFLEGIDEKLQRGPARRHGGSAPPFRLARAVRVLHVVLHPVVQELRQEEGSDLRFPQVHQILVLVRQRPGPLIEGLGREGLLEGDVGHHQKALPRPRIIVFVARPLLRDVDARRADKDHRHRGFDERLSVLVLGDVDVRHHDLVVKGRPDFVQDQIHVVENPGTGEVDAKNPVGLDGSLGAGNVRTLDRVFDGPDLVSELRLADALLGGPVAEVALRQRPEGVDVSIAGTAGRRFPIDREVDGDPSQGTGAGKPSVEEIGGRWWMVRGRKGHRRAEDSHVVVGVARTTAHDGTENVAIARDSMHGRPEKLEGRAAIVVGNVAGIGRRSWFAVTVRVTRHESLGIMDRQASRCVPFVSRLRSGKERLAKRRAGCLVVVSIRQ